ncbi:MAG: YihY family inner membrane protein [Campylobacter sp.]|nr:YihY family inner membrane protein [Campylobacter sp.]
MKTKLKNGFKFIYDERLMHYASSLSFHTIMAFIPILLLSFWLFTKLEIFNIYYTRLKDFIFSALIPSHQEIIVAHIENFLQNSVGLNIFSIIAVIFTSKMFFSDYEYIISKIMLARERSFLNSLGFYLSFIFLAPIGVSFSLWLSNFIQNMLNYSVYTSWINIISIFPYFIVWSIFCLMYFFSTSKDTSFKNAVISSFISSLAWWFGKQIFVYYVFYNKTYLSIYGSFSIMLLFFLWVYISWLIFLYGLKIYKILELK